MAFFDDRMPERLSFGARGGPMFSTEVNKTTGGQRYANGNWLYPLHLFDVSQGVKTQTDFEEIRAFFWVVNGRRDAFRFKDWSDYRAVSQPLVLIGGSDYQLLRRYSHGSRTFDRPIYKPVATPTVYRTRVGVTTAISPTIDLTTGEVTVSGHLGGDTYTWTGEFDVPVAFVNDQLESIIVNRNPQEGFLIEWPSIQLEEIRL